MEFRLSDEQRALIDSTRSLLTDQGSMSATRSLIETGQGYDPKLWHTGAALGWVAIAVDEEHGGLGLGVVEQCLVAIEHGRSLAPTPFIPAAVVADALALHSKVDDPVLEAIVAGESTAAWAFAERGRQWSLDGVRLRAQMRDNRYVLSGAKANVQDAATAEWLLVDVALDDGSPARLLISAAAEGVTRSMQANLDVTRAYSDISFDDVVVEQSALLVSGPPAAADISRSLALGTVLTCAEMVGVGAALLEMTIEYVKNREQFGRPVGSFQAVKHKCSDMRIWLQGATASTYYAAMAIDAAANDAAFAVSAAKAYASDAINRLAGEALQLHGGIGFTWEHDLHLYLRRARTNSLLFGDSVHHRELLCRLVGGGSLPERGACPDVDVFSP